MTMHILVVEDDEDFVVEIQDMIADLPGGCTSYVARSRTEACAQLKANYLDLVILDLKIPTVTGALDAEPQHGLYVFDEIRLVAPGTPIFVLTGSPAEDYIRNLLQHSQRIDIWSEGRKAGTIEFLRKLEINQFLSIICPIADAINALADVELNRGGIELSLAEQRLIRIFAKKYQGVKCVVSTLGQGLSGARVIRLVVTNIQGVQVANAVAKLAGFEVVRSEAERYERHVAPLVSSAAPSKLAILEFGAYNLAGIFYNLADGFDRSIFDIAKQTPEQCVATIECIENATAPWVGSVPETRKYIKQFRQRLLSDETFFEVQTEFGLSWAQSFEERLVQTRWACIHGDLHGCNILVSADGKINLIDFGDVGDGPASLDPVSLELSLLFHPDSAGICGSWPTIDQARNWGALHSYLVNCPFPEFVTELRSWALRVAGGNREIAASAYSYLIRQLKYPDTDKLIAMALLDGVRAFYDVDT